MVDAASKLRWVCQTSEVDWGVVIEPFPRAIAYMHVWQKKPPKLLYTDRISAGVFSRTKPCGNDMREPNEAISRNRDKSSGSPPVKKLSTLVRLNRDEAAASCRSLIRLTKPPAFIRSSKSLLNTKLGSWNPEASCLARASKPSLENSFLADRTRWYRYSGETKLLNPTKLWMRASLYEARSAFAASRDSAMTRRKSNGMSSRTKLVKTIGSRRRLTGCGEPQMIPTCYTLMC